MRAREPSSLTLLLLFRLVASGRALLLDRLDVLSSVPFADFTCADVVDVSFGDVAVGFFADGGAFFNESFSLRILPGRNYASGTGREKCLKVVSQDFVASGIDRLLTPTKATSVLVLAETEFNARNMTALLEESVKAWFRMDSAFFVIELESLSVREFYQAARDAPIIEQDCGTLNSKCDIAAAMRVPKRDFFGTVLTATFDDWDPFTRLDRSGKEWRCAGGIMPDVFQALADSLNFTARFVPNPFPGVWGTASADGTEANGMVGAVGRGETTTSVAGFSVTHERSLFVDFPRSVATARAAAFVRRPGHGRVVGVSNGAYNSEFELEIWVAVAVTMTVSFAALSAHIRFGRRRLDDADASSIACESAQVVLRSSIARGTRLVHADQKRTSFRVGLMTVLLGELVVFTAYRSAMNAFLSVTLLKLPVRSLGEVAEKNFQMLMWENGGIEAYLRYQSKREGGEAEGIYQKAAKKGRVKYFSSTEEGISAMLSSDDSVLFEYLESTGVHLSRYPCQMSPVDTIRLPVMYQSMPLRKGSPYLKIFDQELSRLDESGVVERIKKRYSWREDTSACAEEDKLRQKPLGLENTSLPFALLIGTGFVSFVILVFEALLRKKRRKQAPSQQNETQTSNPSCEKTFPSASDALLLLGARAVLRDGDIGSREKVERLNVLLLAKSGSISF